MATSRALVEGRIMTDPNGQHALPGPLDDEYRALLLALWPGLAVCALAWSLAEPGDWAAIFLRLPLCYGGFAIVSLPGLPALGWCLARAIPLAPAHHFGLTRLGWLGAAMAAPLWHLAIVELSSWLFGSGFFGTAGWLVLFRYAFLLWAATLMAWLVCVIRNRKQHRPGE